MNVIITGTWFTGAIAVDFGVGIIIHSFTVDSNTQITVNITIESWAPIGPHTVCVTTPFGTDCLTDAFTVLGKSSASPSSGPKTVGWTGTVYATDGTPVSAVSGWQRLSITRRVNAPDRITVVLDGRHPAIPYLKTDTIVHFHRENASLGIPLYKEAEGFCRGGRHTWDRQGQYQYQGLFLGLEDMLDRRLLLGGDDQDYALAGHAAESVMKRVVSVQCGLSGSRNLITKPVQNLTVATDLGRGNIYSGYDQGQKLLSYLQELSESQGMAFRVATGTDVNYDVNYFIFQAWPNPYGSDRSATGVVNGRNSSGFAPVVFSEERGNLTTLDYNHSRDGEGNVAVDVESGAVVSSPASTDSPWNDREFWFTPNPGESVDTAAIRELSRAAAREETDISIIQTPHCAYGKHYFLGDVVSVYITGQGVRKSLIKVVTEVTLDVDRRQGQVDEQVSVTLADRPVPVKGAVAESLMNLSERISRLERG